MSSKGWYETSLPWKGNHPPLPNNYTGSLKRLKNLVRKLEMQGELERYNDIIQTRLSQGIVERADEVVKDGREFYISHKAVVRENAESTKIRIVYDASARANARFLSLNECLEIYPGNSWRFKPSILANSRPKRRPRCLTLSLNKGSGKQTGRNLAIHSSTLWFGTVSIPLGRSYQSTSTSIQNGEPGTSG